MRRRLLYGISALLLLAMAGPLLVLALREGSRLLGPIVGDRLFAGIIIATTIFLLLAQLLTFVTFHNRPRPRRRIPLHNRDLLVVPPRRRPQHHPKDFTERLAGYLHCEQDELATPRPYPASNMSFWSRVGRLRWMGPKPAFIIRRLLERIREQVRGRAH